MVVHCVCKHITIYVTSTSAETPTPRRGGGIPMKIYAHLDSAHGSSVDAEVFEADGAETLSEVSPAKVHDILMSNPDQYLL